MKDTTLKKLRVKALERFREYEAIYVLINAMTVDIRKDFDRNKAGLENFNRNQLRSSIRRIEDEIKSLRDRYGITASNTTLEEILERIETFNDIVLIPKYELKKYFKAYENALPTFLDLPEHTYIEIDNGFYRQEQGTIEVYLIETIIYEDLCSLYNLASEINESIITNKKKNKEDMKKISALSRMIITTALYFVEAYLNGIAFDYYMNNIATLDIKTASLLLEYDLEKRKTKYLTLRDKALKYPRIILGLDHSPLNEDNCPELAFIVNNAKDIRDAIVHASPKPNMKTLVPEKEHILLNIKFKITERIVDNAISLVKKLEESIFGHTKRLYWLYDRKPDGAFPEDVFK